MKQIVSLNIGDYITIHDRLFQIVLRPQSNGSKTWRHPILIVVRPEKEQYKRKYVKEIVGDSLKEVELTERDRSVEELYFKGLKGGQKK